VTYILWVDLETTGFVPEIHEPLEICAVMSKMDGDALQVFSTFEAISRPSVEACWDPEAIVIHTSNGLVQECLKAKATTLMSYFGNYLAYIDRDYRPPGKPPEPIYLGGRSVHFDRQFIRHYRPALDDFFHHRHVDVSAIELALNTAGKPLPPVPQQIEHRAVADIERTITQFVLTQRMLRGIEVSRIPMFNVAKCDITCALQATIALDDNSDVVYHGRKKR